MHIKTSFLSTFHYNKDWNPCRLRGVPWNTSFLSTFHYNKDWNLLFSWLLRNVLMLPEHFPLQQGLKLEDGCCYSANLRTLPEHFPLQQGLKPDSLCDSEAVFFLPEHFPLQQGLKPVNEFVKISGASLPEHFPLQQGLKHDLRRVWKPVQVPSWALSITTRIETRGWE